MAGLSDLIVEQQEREIWGRIQAAVAEERERCIEAVKGCASWDTNGYICTKDAAIKAILAGSRDDLSNLSNEELYRRAYPHGIGDVNSGQS